MRCFSPAVWLSLALACHAPMQAEPVKITLLVTTDLHGAIYPYDYYTAAPAARGLAKTAALIEAVRAASAHTMLIDLGDTIQGSPMAAVYHQYLRTGKAPLGLPAPVPPLTGDPMMLAMNRLGYDAMVLGNHEFNFGLASLDAARGDARFPWLSANTVLDPGSSRRPFDPYLVKLLGGVKIAVFGITTPAIPDWEKPENYAGYRFLDGVEAARRTVAGLRARHAPDVLVAAVHAGLGRDPDTGAVRPGNERENMVYQIAREVPGIDALVFGHTHREFNARIGGVAVLQPRHWGMTLGRIDFELEPAAGGGWKLVSTRAAQLPVTSDTAADPAILELARPYHLLTESYLDTPVAESPVAMDGRLARIRDTALLDAVHAVQLHYAQADVSLTALFNPAVSIPKGPVTVRQIASLYIYENELYAVEGDGRMLKAALENAARYFLSCANRECAGSPLIATGVAGYNFDIAQGVEYEIDLTRPEGERIRNLRFRGRPLEENQKLRIAINNYRAGGSGGYEMFRNARLLWRSSREIRDLIVEYYSERKLLPAAPDGNWRIVPDAAVRTLEREAHLEPGGGL